MQQVAPSAPEQLAEVDLELDPSVLEGPDADGVKEMLATPQFAKFRQLYAAKAAAVRAQQQAPPQEPGGGRGAATAAAPEAAE
eukprot:2626761-Pyramimonas_sp.AAC.1